MRRRTLLLIASCLAPCEAFEHVALAARPMPYAAASAFTRADAIVMMAAKKKAAKKPKKAPTKISPKGFGARVATPAGGRLLNEPRYEALYEWLRTNPLTNLRKVAVADFDGLRGVMALQDIDKGEEIVGIPATMAVDLGSDASDPLPAAQKLLATRAVEVSDDYDAENPDDDESGSEERAAYWATLPPPDSPDLCTPDFFSEKQLRMLQWPPLITVTRQRSAQLRKALGATAPSGDTDLGSLSAAGGRMRELRWAVWAVLSRVLTVQGPPDPGMLGGGQPVGRKLLIPFIDMCVPVHALSQTAAAVARARALLPRPRPRI